MFKCIIFPAILFSALISDAQLIIRGKVMDINSHQPLEGATIFEQVSNTKTTTDQNGNFYLKTFASNLNLLVSYVGYAPKLLNAGTANVLKIELLPDAVSLKELTLQTNLSSSFSRISKIDLDLKPVRNTQELLRIVPGLFIAQHAGGEFLQRNRQFRQLGLAQRRLPFPVAAQTGQFDTEPAA